MSALVYNAEQSIRDIIEDLKSHGASGEEILRAMAEVSYYLAREVEADRLRDAGAEEVIERPVY